MSFIDDDWIFYSLLLLIIMLGIKGFLMTENFKKEKKETCFKYTGKTIIDKEVPNYLLYDNKNYIQVTPELYSLKNVGDKINDKECFDNIILSD